jgi:hypothetical protein
MFYCLYDSNKDYNDKTALFTLHIYEHYKSILLAFILYKFVGTFFCTLLETKYTGKRCVT